MTFDEWWERPDKFYARKWPEERETAKVAWDAAIEAAKDALSEQAERLREQRERSKEYGYFAAVRHMEVGGQQRIHELHSWIKADGLEARAKEEMA
jgi:hypothetical protein